MKVLLLQLDGKLPNIALMRIAAHCRPYADDIAFRHCPTVKAVEASDWWGFDRIYASLIFERTRPVAEALLQKYRFAEIGGTGWDVGKRLEDIGITTKRQDYAMYPHYPHSIGFTQRGCRLKCKFCVVPRKEGAVVEEQTVWDIWRKEPYPRNIVLLDNDFFGQPNWRQRIEEIRAGDFKVSFNQGINCRMITDEAAAAITSVRYYDDDFKRRRIYTAWDNLKDEERLFAGLEALTKHGVKPDQIMVYMLIGYWSGETAQERDYRRRRLREFGCRPYPMPFVRTKELVGFQRWVIGAYDKRFTWDHWQAADYRPEKLHLVGNADQDTDATSSLVMSPSATEGLPSSERDVIGRLLAEPGQNLDVPLDHLLLPEEPQCPAVMDVRTVPPIQNCDPLCLTESERPARQAARYAQGRLADATRT